MSIKISIFVLVMARKKESRGRPKMDETKKKVGFSVKLKPDLITRIDNRADEEGRTRNGMIEFVLNEAV